LIRRSVYFPAAFIVFAFVVCQAQRPELVVQTGHANTIQAIAFMPGDKYLLSAGDDGSILVWDVATGHQIRKLVNQGPAVMSASANGLVLSAGKQLRLWRVATGEEIKLPEAKGPAALSPEGNTLAFLSGFMSDQINFLDVQSGLVTHATMTTGKPLNQPVINPDGSVSRTTTPMGPRIDQLVFSPDGTILAAADSSQIRLCDTTTGKLKLALSAHKLGGAVLGFSPDAKLLATAGLLDGISEVKLWDVGTGKLRRSFKTLVAVVAFSPDNKMYATVDTSGNRFDVNVWDASDGKLRRTLNTVVDKLAFSPDGRTLAITGGDNVIQTWDVITGTVVPTSLPGSMFSQLAFSSDGRLLAGSSVSDIRLWDISSARQVRELQKRSQNASAVALSADGKYMAMGMEAGQVLLWDLINSKEPKLFTGGGQYAVRALALSPDGKRLLAGGGDIAEGGEIAEWDIETGRKLFNKDHAGAAVRTASFSSDGRLFITGHGWSLNESGIKVWNADTGQEVRTLNENSAPTASSRDYVPALSAEGNRFARVRCEEKGATVELWQFDGTNKLRDFDDTDLPKPEGVPGACPFFYKLALSSNGKTLARVTTTNEPGFKVRLWDTATGAHQDMTTANGTIPDSITFSADGKSLAINAQIFDAALKRSRRGIELIDIASKTERTVIRDCSFCLHSTAFSPDGRLLLTGSEDNTISFSDASNGEELLRLSALSERGWLVTSPDGLFDGATNAWAQMVWRFSPVLTDYAPVEAYFREFFHPGLLPRIVHGDRPKSTAQIEQLDRRQPAVELAVNEPLGNALSTRSIKVTIKTTEQLADKDHQTGSGAQDLRLFRNGSLVKVWRDDVLKGKTSVSLEATVPIVAGENRLTAYAFNHDNVKSADSSLLINGAETLKRRGTAYILAIGINEYENPEFRLNYAVADAEDFGAELKRRQEQLQAFDRVQVTSLIDKDATKARILQTLATLREQAQPEDIVIVYFAGHGRADNKQFYLIPHDLGYAGPRMSLDAAGFQTIFEHSISDRDLEKSFEGIDARQLVLIIDACNSGQALDSDESRRGPMNSKGLAQLAYEKGMYILTASQSYEDAKEEKALGHGYLTYALVESGLKKGAADREPRNGTINLREWLDFATDEVPEMQRKTAKPGADESTQQPRVFYRRELEANQLVVAMLGATSTQ
jgi:WD40 repeat protein/uncharacterized caspase-like protein